MVRNVYRALRPSTSYDSSPPAVPELFDPGILVFSKTNGFRHDGAIEAGIGALREIASRRGWSMFHTENGAVFDTPILGQVRVLVWHNASGAPLSSSQRTAVQHWVQGGGGFVGIHAALDASHASWDWYLRSVVGALFIGHPIEHQMATIRVERQDHPTMSHLAEQWRRVDEWYSWERSVRDDSVVEVLASLDESTYETRMKFLWTDKDLTMGDHPVIWTREVGQGRAFLSALGHEGSAYEEPEYLAVLEGAIAWAGRLQDPESEPSEAATAGD